MFLEHLFQKISFHFIEERLIKKEVATSFSGISSNAQQPIKKENGGSYGQIKLTVCYVYIIF